MKSHPPKHIKTIGLLLSILGLVLVGIVIIGVSLYGIDQRETKTVNLQSYVVEGESGGYFSLGLANTSLVKNTRNSFNINLNTQGENVTAARVIINYDPAKIKINTAENSGPFTVFSREVDESAGTVRVSLYFSNSIDTFNGNSKVASVSFTPLSTDSSSFAIDCDASRVNTVEGNIINCDANQNLTLNNITEASSDDNSSDNSDSDNNDSDDSGTGGGNISSSGSSGSEPSREPWCQKSYPARPTGLKAVPGTQRGQVKLTWNKVDGDVTHYTVTYGERWLDFDYGSPNIGNTDQFMVNGLPKTNVIYYFVVTAVNDCASSGYSDGASSYAGTGPAITATTTSWSSQTTTVVTPKPTAMPTAQPYYEENESTDSAYQPLPTVSPVVYTPPQEDTNTEGLLSKMEGFLPWIGLIVLLLLGGLFILLVKYLRQQND